MQGCHFSEHRMHWPRNIPLACSYDAKPVRVLLMRGAQPNVTLNPAIWIALSMPVDDGIVIMNVLP